MAEATAMPEVPLEIWDHIIDYLEGDYDTLLSCHLVCKSWRRRSSTHIPDMVYLRDREDVVQEATQTYNQWKGPSRVAIIGGTSRWDRISRVPHLASFAIMLGHKWRGVNQLLIQKAEWKMGDMPSSIFLHLSTWESITELTIHDAIFPSASTLWRLLTALPNLALFTCRRLHFSSTAVGAGTIQPSLLKGKLKIRQWDIDMSDVLALPCTKWMWSVCDLNSVVFVLGSRDEPGILEKTIACLSSMMAAVYTYLTVRKLRIKFYVSWAAPSTVSKTTTQFEFVQSTEPDWFEIKIFVLWLLPYKPSDYMKWTATILSRSESNNIDEIRLTVPQPESLTSEDLAAAASIDDVLTRPIYKGLKSVALKFRDEDPHPAEYYHEQTAKLRSFFKLPKLEEKTLLYIEAFEADSGQDED